MKQIKIGEWLAMLPAAAMVVWVKLREARKEGQEPMSRKRSAANFLNGDMVPQPTIYTVGNLCRGCLEGHVERRRKMKGANEIVRMFGGSTRCMIYPVSGC
ncbi:hypothetical protein QS306_06185 [Paraburkholderia bonniea]|uniref:hypothetical protein n=1 Tax=Paraburkholderia bonniea TaxID=2152891 RepID=UPI002573393B|nr:hypothetical protein [Paraburkholderia bonniea]WJF91220.1 hypothetical protein QS306_06185 [Paraburkholderia bonniea]WJF94534.1 hypothetical protein QS308_06190 [Paraburkholderia bonniea]